MYLSINQSIYLSIYLSIHTSESNITRGKDRKKKRGKKKKKRKNLLLPSLGGSDSGTAELLPTVFVVLVFFFATMHAFAFEKTYTYIRTHT